MLKYRLLVENELHLISKSCLICEGNHSENACTDLYPSEVVKEDFRKMGGAFECERKPYERKGFASRRVHKIDPDLKFSQKAMIPMMWAKFKKMGLGEIVVGLSQNEKDELDEVCNFKSYFPGYNF